MPAASSPPMNALERAREQMRLRQLQASEVPIAQPVSEPKSEQVLPQQAPERPAEQSLELAPLTPTIDSVNPPLAP